MRHLVVSLVVLSAFHFACGRDDMLLAGAGGHANAVSSGGLGGGAGIAGGGEGGNAWTESSTWNSEPPSPPPPIAGYQSPASSSVVAGRIATGGVSVVTAAGGFNMGASTGGFNMVTTTGGFSMVVTTGGFTPVITSGGAIVAGGNSGGAPRIGGTSGTSKSSSSGPRPNGDVTFRGGVGQGLMTGNGWVDLGQSDRLTSPTCDSGPITASMPCMATTKWSKPDALCMSGSIPALPASPVQADYDNNWGVQVGVNASEPPDELGSSMSSFTTVAFKFSGDPKTGVRAFLHRKGDPDATTYCVDSIKSDVPIALTKFNTKCWGDFTTVYLTFPDLPHIDRVSLGVSSTSAPITVSNFCLERISFK